MDTEVRRSGLSVTSPTLYPMASSSSKSSSERRRAPRTAKPRTPGGVIGGFLGAIVMSVVAGVLLTAAVTPVVAISGAAAKSAIEIFNDLPDHLNPGRLAQPSTLVATASDGTEIEFATFFAQNREMVGWDQISQYVKDAAVAVEDPRFYSHSGVDVLGLGRAVLGQATGQDSGGASTITMQYVRNVLVQEAEAIPDEAEREAAYNNAMRQDVDRKLQEIRYAVSIEKQYSKDEILLGYLNIALFGRTNYGIESAAQYYYGKSAADVTLAEAASLVAIVQNPSVLQIDLEQNIPNNQTRRDHILGKMLETGRITQAQYDEAIATPVTPNITPRPSGCATAESIGLGHFCNYVQLYIERDPSFGNDVSEREFNFLRGGMRIKTTIDLDIQAAGLAAMQAEVPPVMDGIDVGAASVSVEVGTGRVLGMVQNRSFSNDPAALDADPGLTAINYNTDNEYGGSNGFQVGSTFKALTLAEWINSGHSVREVVNANGRTVQYQSFKAECLGGVYGTGSFTFQNDQGRQHGNQSVLNVIANSINGGVVSMQQKMDLCSTFQTAQNLGVHRASDQPRDENGTIINPTLHQDPRDLTVVPAGVYAGTDEIAPITMATAFAAFAGGGMVCTPVPIDSITGPDGEDVPFTKSQCKNGVTPEVAAGVAYALEYTVNNGLARHARSAIGIPHLAKTGTTDDVVDNWTVGASTRVATATWVGNVTGKVSTQLFGGWTGLMIADQAIWPAMMDVADAKYGGEAFPPPLETATKQTLVTVPDVKGKSYEEASQMLTALGFSVSDGGTADSAVSAGMVSSTNPAAGEGAPQGADITIYRSNGSMSTIPEIPSGSDGNDAKAALNSAGFSSVTIGCKSGTGSAPNPGTKPFDSLDPPSGTEAIRTNQVRVIVDCT